MREPAFWRRRFSVLSAALSPVAALYGAIAASRMARSGIDAGVPVICVGNYTMGGAGKTPTVLALVEMLHALGETPFVLSRGYGGRLRGPVRVDALRHTARDVGDEPLMMAASASVVVARDRVDGAALARSGGASVIVMDDGFQNPSLRKDVSLIVIDAARGLQNGRGFPAGPLRAPFAAQLARTDALVVIGDGDEATPVAVSAAKRSAPVFRAKLTPDPEAVEFLSGQRMLAFAGIGDPSKFFRTLREAKIDVVETRAFPDHHFYSSDDIASLRKQAQGQSLTLVTTRKDVARLGENASGIASLDVSLKFSDEAALRSLIIARLNRARATPS